MARISKARSPAWWERQAVVEILVCGFKSIADEQSVEIRPLTILAGANSSGKSSMVQPLLLLKQTLEATHDPGTLLLNGPNVKFTSADQLLSRFGRRRSLDRFHVGMRLAMGDSFETVFRKQHKIGFRIEKMDLGEGGDKFSLRPGMSHAEIVQTGVTKGHDFSAVTPEDCEEGHWEIESVRSFLEPTWVARGPDGLTFSARPKLTGVWEGLIPEVIYLSGLRGNPERAYPVTAVGPTYPGTFEIYTASVISQWMAEGKDILAELNKDLKLLKLTGGVTAIRVNDVQIELHVGRLPNVAPTRPEDRVNIADVGIGVSQTLPILVALRAAKPGQLVYVEQPETHLHPRAQFALAEVLASAAKRGVRVVVETHSSILLLGVQTLVAEGSLDPEKIKLHWFKREKDGRTVIRPADLDEAGRFGDWPADFDDVTLKAESRFLDAAEARLAGK